MNPTTTRAAVSTPNHSSGGGGRRVTRDAATMVTATKPTMTTVSRTIVACPTWCTPPSPVMSCSRVQTDTRTWPYRTS